MRPTAAMRSTVALLRATVESFIVRRWIASAGLMILSAGLVGLTPVIYKLLIDTLAGAPSGRTAVTVAVLIGAYIVVQVVSRVAAEVRTLVHGQGQLRLTRRLSARLFGHLVRLPLRFHLDRKTGAMGESLTQGLVGLQLLLQHALFTLLPVVIEFATIVGVLVYFNHSSYLLICLPTAIAYFFVFQTAAANVMAPARESSAAQIDARAVLADSLLNHETVKYLAAEVVVTHRYDTASGRAESAGRRLLNIRTVNGVTAAIVFALSLIASLGHAGYEVLQGTMTVGGFTLIAAYIVRIAQPIETLGFAARDLSQGMGFLEKMLELLDESPELDATSAPRVLKARGALRFEHVSFAYEPEREVLRDVSFTVAPGRTVAIVGMSGSGKSSLIRLLFRLYEPDGGQILLDGVPIGAMDLRTLRRMIAMVPQDTVLFNDTLENNIYLANPEATSADIAAAAKMARLDELIAALPDGYQTRVGERGLKLSGGERQRVAIARAALMQPLIYVFDEATSSLDSKTEREIIRNLIELGKTCTTLVIAHRLSTIAHADEIVVLHGGSVVEQGSHNTLLAANGHYAELWRAQSPQQRSTLDAVDTHPSHEWAG